MVRRPSVVNNFKHLLLQNRLPNQSQILPGPWVGGTKVCSLHVGHMTKMAVTNVGRTRSPTPLLAIYAIRYVYT